MKHKKILVVILFILIVTIGTFVIVNSRKIINNEVVLKKMHGEPIKEDGTINNNYFGINSNGKNAKDTLIGINNAIKYASNNNIKNIKLEKGTYLIDSQKDNSDNHYQEKGITFKSNIELNLNGSIIKHIPNSRNSYALVSIINVENASIYNGTIEGDRENHTFTDTTHQFGHGIDIAGGKNINIYNLEIKNMIGDGIYITDRIDLEKAYVKTQKVKIADCNIYNCRRQGITITIADGVEICRNEIHSINGADPQTCIDLETGNKEHIIKNIKISENKLYSAESKRTIVISKNVYNVEISNNEIDGQIRTYNAEEEIDIFNNTISNGAIIGLLSSSNLYEEHYNVNKIKITKNVLKNSYIAIGRLNDCIIENNEISNGYIHVESMNGAIINNIVKNEKDIQQEYAYLYKYNKEDEKNYTIYTYNNVSEGKFKQEQLESLGENMEINSQIEKIKEYYDFFEHK